MYINKIEELIGKILDDFFFKEIEGNKLIDKLIDEQNYYKYNVELQEFIQNFIKKISYKSINDIINDANIKIIQNIVMRYLLYYIFLYIGFPKKDKEKYVNNLLDFNKNQQITNKIKNFYTSENNYNVINYYDLIKNIYTLVNIDEIEYINDLTTKYPGKYDDAINFLNDVGYEYVITHFKGKKNINIHNIIKSIIIVKLYVPEDKIEIFNILSNEEQNKVKFKYIDIILPIQEQIDISMIEDLLSINLKIEGYAKEIYDMLLLKQENLSSESKQINEKIQELFNKKLVIPITDEFMRYYKDLDKENIDTEYKKDDTKIKSVISKINKASEFYSSKSQHSSNLTKDIDKIFYQPLIYKKAILYNEIEELQILNKIELLSHKSKEVLEYYEELKHYRLYQYINFKNIQNNGLSFLSKKTIDAIRYINIENINYHRVEGIKNNIQTRIICGDTRANIIGLLIPSIHKPIECTHLTDLVPITKYDQNGYSGILNYIQKSIFDKNAEQKKIITYSNSPEVLYWIFNLKNDIIKLNNYYSADKNDIDYNCKLLLMKLYNDIVSMVFDKIMNKLIQYDNLSIANGLSITNYYQNKLLQLSPELYNKIKKVIYFDKATIFIPEYDKNDDKIAGINGTIIKLPILEQEKEKEKIIKYKSDSNEIIKNYQFDGLEDAICQHFVVWNKISSIRARNPNKFQQLFSEFFNDYVVLNEEMEYTCKSCGQLINIRKLNVEYQAEYDIININIDVLLENLQEYEKYSKSIKSMDKLIERIAGTMNLVYYIGNTQEVIMRRQTIIKEIIDLITLQNKTWKSGKQNTQERNQSSGQLYGISPSLTQLYMFDFDNELFAFSSKDVDKYKRRKYNNIICHIMFSFIREMNIPQLYQLNYDKVCNYTFFDKYIIKIFDGLFIRINNGNDIVEITKYMPLCYLIFNMSCLVIKYDIYNFQDITTLRKFDPLMFKIIINTFVDLVDSILEQSTIEKKYLYELVSKKFFSKLMSVFNNTEILDQIQIKETQKKQHDKSSQIANITSKIPVIPINGLLDFITLNKMPKHIFGESVYFIKNTIEQISDPSQILSKETYNKLLENIRQKYDDKLSQIYNTDGTIRPKHSIVEETNKNISSEKANTMINNILIKKEKKRLEDIKQQININDYIENKESIKNKILKKITSEYEKNNSDINTVIDNFDEFIEQIIGYDVNINNSNLYIKYDTYIIDHSYIGIKLKEPFIIKNKNNQINYKINDPFFKVDVIFYTDKAANISVFYNAYTYNLLGYKESNKEYVAVSSTNNYIKLNLSIHNKLKYLGYTTKYIDIEDEYNQLSMFDKNEKNIKKQLVTKIIRNRINQIKKIIEEIITILNQIKNNYNNNDISPVAKKYINKFEQFLLQNEQSKIFNYANLVKDSVFVNQIDNINIELHQKHFLIDDLIKLNNSDNLLLSFIINEFKQLITINNSNKVVQINVINLIIDIIQYLYKLYFTEILRTENKRFQYLITAESGTVGIDEQSVGIYNELKEELTEEQQQHINEQSEDDKYSEEALDVTTENDNPDFVDEDIEYNADWM